MTRQSAAGKPCAERPGSSRAAVCGDGGGSNSPSKACARIASTSVVGDLDLAERGAHRHAPRSRQAASLPPAHRPPARTAALTARPTASPSPSAGPAGVIRYVALGASDSVGIGATDPARGSWPARVAALMPPGSTFTNLAVSGSLVLQAQREQLPGA